VGLGAPKPLKCAESLSTVLLQQGQELPHHSRHVVQCGNIWEGEGDTGVVTNAILHFSGNRTTFLAQVNTFFGSRRGFVSVDAPELPRGWYGGSKMLERDLAIGAFNHLDLDALIHHLRAIAPDGPYLQLMVCEQEERRFRLINGNDEPAVAT
jgi:hypothetical protein